MDRSPACRGPCPAGWTEGNSLPAPAWLLGSVAQKDGPVVYSCSLMAGSMAVWGALPASCSGSCCWFAWRLAGGPVCLGACRLRLVLHSGAILMWWYVCLAALAGPRL